ncbi:hypothetical protein G7009_00335 [Pseudomonas capeferrum]|uniref:hypothetical protein n=1 Tax=Pseudomonas capeferrum TaxID=1495066 RepID=UPI0015E411AB|nr:hypothetical protein [Pseudomonas capeferrum]MBA1200252.1 hypothetical protein [Pseudomonas capeferrum]
MPRSPRLLLSLVLLGALVACDQEPSREEKILADFPLQEVYENNIDKMATLLMKNHDRVPKDKIKEVLRRHLTPEDQHRDVIRLYGEKNFTDAEFETLVSATRDPAKAKALEHTVEGRQLEQKLSLLMLESAKDEQSQALARDRMQRVEADLAELQQGTSSP